METVKNFSFFWVFATMKTTVQSKTMSHESARQMWNADAPNWVEHQHLGRIAPVLEAFVRGYSEEVLAYTPGNSRIVDLGTGANTRVYFPAAAHNRIVGLDFSIEMLRHNTLRQKTVAEMTETLPLASESIGLVTSFLAWRYLSSQEHAAVIQELYRVLVPYGTVLLIDILKNHWQYQKSEFSPDVSAQQLTSAGLSVRRASVEKVHAPLGYTLPYTANMGVVVAQKLET